MERVRLLARRGRNVDDAMSAAVTDELPVELGPALGLDLTLERLVDIEVATQPSSRVTRS